MYKNIKKLLEQKEREITNRIQKIDADKTRTSGPLSADSGEQVVELENNEVIDGIDDLSRNELDEIRAALKKIADGTYGMCEACQKPIPIDRLEAIPNAARCIQCEEEHENAEA